MFFLLHITTPKLNVEKPYIYFLSFRQGDNIPVVYILILSDPTFLNYY